MDQTQPAAAPHSWVRITGAADFGAMVFSQEIIIQGSHFERPLDLSDARFGKSLDLRGCVLARGLDLSVLHVLGSLLLTNVEIQAGNEGPRFADCSLMRIQGNFDAESLNSQVRLAASGVRVAGNVDFTSARITGGLDLEVANIDGSLYSNFLTVRNSEGSAADGDVLLGGLQVAGQVSFCGAQIARDLVMYSSDIACGLRCSSLKSQRTIIGGNALLGAAKVSFGADFSGVRIEGQLNLEDAVIEGQLTALNVPVQPPAEKTVAAEPNPTDAHNLDGWQRTEVYGQALLGGLKVTGEVRFNGIFVRQGLNLSTTELKGGLYCGPFRGLGAEFGGPVLLSAARLGVNADFSEARIVGPLNLQNAVIDGDLFCHRTEIVHDEQEEEAHGNFSFGGLKVMGQLSLNGARVAGDINLQTAVVKGGIFGRPLPRRKPEHGALWRHHV